MCDFIVCIYNIDELVGFFKGFFFIYKDWIFFVFINFILFSMLILGLLVKFFGVYFFF